jgi:positive regulator of sigma E activity
MTEFPEDIGTVTAINGKEITVEIEKGGGCKSCGMKGLCGSDNKPVVLHFQTDDTYQIGDRVNVSISSGIRILSSLLVFVFPLLALFGFYFIGKSFTNELGSIITGFAGMILAFVIIRFLDKKIAKRIDFQLGGKCEDLS